MAAPSFTSFAFRASTTGWEEEQALVSRIDQMEKCTGLRSGLLAGQTSLLMNEEIFLWIQEWVILEAWERAEPCCRGQVTPWKCFLARAASNTPKCQCRRCSAGSANSPQRAQKTERTSRALARPPKPWKTAHFGVWCRPFPLWMTRKPKLGHFIGCLPAGCRISSRP